MTVRLKTTIQPDGYLRLDIINQQTRVVVNTAVIENVNIPCQTCRHPLRTHADQDGWYVGCPTLN